MADHMKQTIVKFWQERNPREKIILLYALLFLVLFSIYFIIISPFQNHINHLKQETLYQQKLYYWILNHQYEIEPNKQHKQIKASLLQASLSHFNISQDSQQITVSNKSITLKLNNISFDTLINWLEYVNKKYHWTMQSIRIHKTPKSGLVNIQLKLRK